MMEEFGYGPNGGLVYCMEYLFQNSDWLKNELENFSDDGESPPQNGFYLTYIV